MWPFRRRRDGSTVAPQEQPTPVVLRSEAREWASLPPLEPSVPAMDTTFATSGFQESLASHAPPKSFLAPLRHVVSPVAPAGVVSGLATVSRSVSPSGPPLPSPLRIGIGRKTTPSPPRRRTFASRGSMVQAGAVDVPPRPMPVVAEAPPRDADLTRAQPPWLPELPDLDAESFETSVRSDLPDDGPSADVPGSGETSGPGPEDASGSARRGDAGALRLEGRLATPAPFDTREPAAGPSELPVVGLPVVGLPASRSAVTTDKTPTTPDPPGMRSSRSTPFEPEVALLGEDGVGPSLKTRLPLQGGEGSHPSEAGPSVLRDAATSAPPCGLPGAGESVAGVPSPRPDRPPEPMAVPRPGPGSTHGGLPPVGDPVAAPREVPTLGSTESLAVQAAREEPAAGAEEPPSVARSLNGSSPFPPPGMAQPGEVQRWQVPRHPAPSSPSAPEPVSGGGLPESGADRRVEPVPAPAADPHQAPVDDDGASSGTPELPPVQRDASTEERLAPTLGLPTTAIHSPVTGDTRGVHRAEPGPMAVSPPPPLLQRDRSSEEAVALPLGSSAADRRPSGGGDEGGRAEQDRTHASPTTPLPDRSEVPLLSDSARAVVLRSVDLPEEDRVEGPSTGGSQLLGASGAGALLIAEHSALGSRRAGPPTGEPSTPTDPAPVGLPATGREEPSAPTLGLAPEARPAAGPRITPGAQPSPAPTARVAPEGRRLGLGAPIARVPTPVPTQRKVLLPAPAELTALRSPADGSGQVPLSVSRRVDSGTSPSVQGPPPVALPVAKPASAPPPTRVAATVVQGPTDSVGIRTTEPFVADVTVGLTSNRPLDLTTASPSDDVTSGLPTPDSGAPVRPSDAAPIQRETFGLVPARPLDPLPAVDPGRLSDGPRPASPAAPSTVAASSSAAAVQRDVREGSTPFPYPVADARPSTLVLARSGGAPLTPPRAGQPSVPPPIGSGTATGTDAGVQAQRVVAAAASTGAPSQVEPGTVVFGPPLDEVAPAGPRSSAPSQPSPSPVQRAAATTPAKPSVDRPPEAQRGGTVPSGLPADLDELAAKLYDRMLFRLRRDLRQDLERKGHSANLRR